MFFKERAAAFERYQCATASERKCAADIFFCLWLLLETFFVFKERAATSEKILTTAFERKCAAAFLELCPLKKYFEIKNRLK